MPSKGNRILSVRVEPGLLAEIEAAIDAANERRFDRPYDTAAWIKQVIREKLDHLRWSRGERSPARRRRRPAGQPASTPTTPKGEK